MCERVCTHANVWFLNKMEISSPLKLISVQYDIERIHKTELIL